MWFCKTLGYWQIVLETEQLPGARFELNYNEDYDEIRLKHYTKVNHVVVHTKNVFREGVVKDHE